MSRGFVRRLSLACVLHHLQIQPRHLPWSCQTVRGQLYAGGPGPLPCGGHPYSKADKDDMKIVNIVELILTIKQRVQK